MSSYIPYNLHNYDKYLDNNSLNNTTHVLYYDNDEDFIKKDINLNDFSILKRYNPNLTYSQFMYNVKSSPTPDFFVETRTADKNIDVGNYLFNK